MQRAGSLVMIVGIGLTITGPTLADIAPPPPPKGLKYVGIEHEFKIAPDVKGFVFVEVVSRFREKSSFRKLTPKPDQAIALAPYPGRRGSVALYILTDAHAKKYANDQALFEAIDKSETDPTVDESLVPIYLEYETILESKDPRKSVKWTHTFKGMVNQKAIIERKGDGKEPTYNEDGPGGAVGPYVPEDMPPLAHLPESEGSIAARQAMLADIPTPATNVITQPRNMWVAGIASALAISLLGLWVARRRGS